MGGEWFSEPRANLIAPDPSTLDAVGAVSAMAVAAHVDRHPPRTGPMGVNDVEVADLGPAGRTDDGKMVIDKSDLVDRMEF